MNDQHSKIVNQERSSLWSIQNASDANTHKKVQEVFYDPPAMFIYHDVNDVEPSTLSKLL